MSRQDDIQATQVRGEAQVSFAQDALRGIVLLNGGAVLALLTFFGQAWSKSELQAKVLIQNLKPSVAWLLIGTAAGIVAQGLAYLAQQAFVEERRTAGRGLRRGCVVAAVLGIVAFCWGSYTALMKFT